MNRRELLPVLGAAGWAGTAADAFAAAPAGYRPRALSPDEYALVTRLANSILPADAESAGAGDAGAAFFIDTLLHHGPAAAREEFRAGLTPMLGLGGARLDAALASAAKEESRSGSFFARLKSMVIDAYCLSPEGRKFLRYTGDGAIPSFEGCQHPEHRR